MTTQSRPLWRESGLRPRRLPAQYESIAQSSPAGALALAPNRTRLFVFLIVLASSSEALAQAAGAGAAGAEAPAKVELPAEHVPKVTLDREPKANVVTGDVVHVRIRADAPEGDDVTVPEQSFAPFELAARRAHPEPEKNGRRTFVFELDLLALEPGQHVLSAITLRVVTKGGVVGETTAPALPIEVKSLLANEPNAQPKPATKPVVVMQDDYTWLYVGGGLLGAALIALLTWFVMRWLARRPKVVPPPPPPRPPWEIAASRLADLRRRKQRMIEEGKAAQFVDEVSDVVRQYLGGLFGFDGLETTTDEMVLLLRDRNAKVGLMQEVGAYLRRCDLVKFAKVEPDQDEADLVFAKAQDIVQFSMPVERVGQAPLDQAAEAPPPPAPPTGDAP